MDDNLNDTDPMEALADNLFSALVPSEFDASKFWPANAVNNAIEENVVRRVLDTANIPYDDDLVAFITGGAKKLFAITATIDSRASQLLATMKFFQSQKMQDDILSAEFLDSRGSTIIDSDSTSLTEKLASLNSKLWRPAMRSKFGDERWKALAPIFSTAHVNYDFKRMAIFPFDSVERDIKRGAFSRVHKVSIHPGHYDDPDYPKEDWPTHFAIKEIVPPDQEQRLRVAENWGHEANTLKQMNRHNREHIIRFITAFTRGERKGDMSYYLMFEWADGGSLEDLWHDNPKCDMTADFVKQAVTQVLGLAKALHATHYQNNGSGTRHGDLKPDNILRFRPTKENIFGTLKIGDWGLAKYHNTATVLRGEQGENTTTTYGTPLYEPPEVTLRAGNVKLLGRQYDIWSMGCVSLELIIWSLYGYDDMKRFRGEVRGSSKNPVALYKTVGDGRDIKASLRETVVRWMDHMAKDPACAEDTAMGELLKLIRNRLLVVELPPQRGQTIYAKDWTPPSRQSSSVQTPGFKITLADDSEEPRGRNTALYRATSEEFMNSCEAILDDEDRPAHYWCGEVTPGFKREGPHEIATKSVQDEYGFLTSTTTSTGRTASTGRSRQVSQGSIPITDMRQLSVQEKEFIVSTYPYDSSVELH